VLAFGRDRRLLATDRTGRVRSRRGDGDAVRALDGVYAHRAARSVRTARASKLSHRTGSRAVGDT
jgi:hypothetical protein